MPQPRAIGVICPVLWGTYICELLGGVESVARRAGAEVIAILSDPRDIHRKGLSRNLISGWITVVHSDGIELFLDDGKPVVAVSAYAKDAPCPYILPDNHGGALAAVRHLIEHGHRRIAFAGNLTHEDLRQRLRAYQQALQEAGIPFDPGLVLEVPTNERRSGRRAAQQILESHPDVTALFVATDPGALGAMSALRDAGRRIPEDIAVIGFDDIEAARFATPSLTTVRQRIDVIGKTAAQMLFDLLDGREVPRDAQITPTLLVRRRSCGCSPALPRGEPSSPAHGPALHGPALYSPAPHGPEAWHDRLARDLAALVSFPAAPNQDGPAASPWPGAADLIDGLRAAAEGRPGPSRDTLERAWRRAAELMPDVDALLMVLDRLERAGEELLQGRSGQGAEQQVAAYLRQARRDLLSGRLASEKARVDHLNGLLDINLVIRESILARAVDVDSDVTDAASSGKLSWLSAAQASWACLGVWEDPSGSGPALRVVESVLHDEPAASPAPGARIGAADFPPCDDLPASVREDDHVIRLVPLRSETRDYGLLAIRAPASSPVSLDRRNMDMWVAMLAAAFERTSLITSLVEEEQRTRAAYERERELADAVRRLGCPVIPLGEGVLLVPLIGVIDADRAAQVLDVVLQELNRQQARVLLMDITAVPFADANVAEALVKTARAAVLLGAQVFVVGMRPQVAQGFVSLGIDLHEMTFYPTLGEALRALRYGPRERRGAP